MKKQIIALALAAFMSGCAAAPNQTGKTVCAPWSGDNCESTAHDSRWSVAIFREGESAPSTWPHDKGRSAEAVARNFCGATTTPWQTPVTRVQVTHSRTGAVTSIDCNS